jgi:FxsC-like protein
MSYARADDQHREEKLIRGFFDDLRAEVEIRVTDRSPPIAYFDEANLNPGDSWPQDIAEALSSCRTFLPVLTARYFTREFCGKEWMIFDDRCRSFGGPKPPPLIIPIQWVPPVEGRFPEYATDLMMTFDPTIVPPVERRNLEDYSKYGLLHVAKRKKTTHLDAYETILERTASHVIQVAQDYPLHVGNALPSLKDAPSRFAPQQQGWGVSSAASLGGGAASTRANFAFVTANLAKMSSVREDAQNYYGKGSEVDWMPYAPNEPEPVGLIAQSVAMEKRLIADWIPVGPGLIQLLERAESDNSVAIMIVDPWIVRHPQYRDILREFDRFQFRNCVVLIPWNKSDQKTQAARNSLLELLRNVLSRNFEGRKELYFRPVIEEYAALRSAISSALSDLEALLARYRQPARKTGESDHNQPPQLQASGSAT